MADSDPPWVHSELGAELLDQVIQHAQDPHTRSAGSRVTLLHKTVGRHSEISAYCLRTHLGLKSVVVKRTCPPTPSAVEALQREYATLQKLVEDIGGQLGDTLPRPLMFSGTHMVVTMLSGTQLHKELKHIANVVRGPLKRNALETIGERVGEWLRKFHELTSAGSLPHDHQEFGAEIDKRIAQCGVRDATLARVREVSLEMSQSIEGTMIPAAFSHGDFIPQNILVRKESVAVVDFANCSEQAPIYEDVAHFLGYVALLKTNLMYSPDALQSLASGFQAGYAWVLDPELLRLFLFKAMLRMISDSPPAGSLFYRFRAGKLNRLLIDLADRAREPLALGRR